MFGIAASALGCSIAELEIGGGRVFLRNYPHIGIKINSIIFGHTGSGGNLIGGQIIGRGSYVLENLAEMDPDTGKGNPGPEWNVGAAVVEVEFDKKECTYRITRSACVVDTGRVINPGLEKDKRVVPINQAFNQKLQLEEGELLFQLTTDMSYSDLPCICVKKTKQGKIGYPLISMAALKKDNNIRIAFSGVCSFPFRSEKMEEAINNKAIPKEQRIEQAVNNLPAPIFGNVQGSSEYKESVLRNLLDDILEALDGEER